MNLFALPTADFLEEHLKSMDGPKSEMAAHLFKGVMPQRMRDALDWVQRSRALHKKLDALLSPHAVDFEAILSESLLNEIRSLL